MGMRSRTRLAACALSLGIAAAGIAAAADSAARVEAVTRTADAGRSAPAQQPAIAMRASRLIGMRVDNSRGDILGSIEDLAVDVNNARVYYAVLAFDPNRFSPEKLFAYPIRTLHAQRGSDRLILNVTPEQLRRAPGFARTARPDLNVVDGYRQRVDRYFGDVVRLEPLPDMVLRYASRLMKGNLLDTLGNDIGDVRDIVVDSGNGLIRYLIVAFEPGWFPPDRLAALPVRATYAPAGNRSDLVLRLAREQIGSAPSFARERWPDLDAGPYWADVDLWYRDVDEAASAGRPAAENNE